MADSTGPRPTALGVVVSLLLIIGLVCVGSAVVFMKARQPEVATEVTTRAEPDAAAADIELVPAATAVPRLDPAAPYVVKDNVVVVELSEYAGYAGLIAANGGLEPNPDSFFAKNYGFQVKLTLSEEESWSALNSGKIAASATTADVLAVYGRQFQVTVPAQIGFSRGADGIVVRSDIKRLNDLAGKVVVASQFTEAEFFLRYLASEAGIPVLVSDDPAPRDPKAITVVFAEDAFVAGDVFLADLQGAGKLAGCVSWEPKTSEVVEASGGKAKVLVTNRNLLVIADILIVNKGFADQNPKMVEGLVDGLLEGNRRVRDNPEQELALVGKAFGWSPADTKDELAKVHLSNLPENLAFFNGEIDMAGSFGGICPERHLRLRPRDCPRARRSGSLPRSRPAPGAGAGRKVREPDHRDRADQGGHARHGRGRPAPVEGHPLLLRAQLVAARHAGSNEPREPRLDPSPAAGQSGLDDPSARARRRCEEGRVPQEGR